MGVGSGVQCGLTSAKLCARLGLGYTQYALYHDAVASEIQNTQKKK